MTDLPDKISSGLPLLADKIREEIEILESADAPSEVTDRLAGYAHWLDSIL